MIQTCGGAIRMAAGEYGAPLPVRITKHCEGCAQDLEETDGLVFAVSRRGRVYFECATTWGDLLGNNGNWEITMTRAESEAMDQGRYAYRIYLLRSGEVLNTIMGPGEFEVI